MKKSFFSLTAAICLCAVLLGRAYAAEEISAKAAIVYEPTTGSVLYEKNANERLLIASTTKIMTAMVVLENCELDEEVDITREHCAVEGSSMYLRPGGKYTVEDLLYGLMLASGNDAAAALAQHVAGSMDAFAELMNRRCRELGLENSHFANAHGLDAKEHYSSAADLAVITAAAMENEDFCRIFSTASYNVAGVDYYNHNKLLGTYPGCIGGKTGYTEKAGRSLVSCVERDGMRLICVTLSDPKDWEDHKALYDRCYESYGLMPIPAEDLVLPIASGEELKLRLCTEQKGLIVEKSAEISYKIYLPRFAFAPVGDDEKLGYMEILCDGEALAKIDILSCEAVGVESGPLRLWRCKNP